jgi:hypothetical protein
MGDGSSVGSRRTIGDADRFQKTEAGRAEIANRSQKLSPALRSILVLVDGHRDAGSLRKLGAGLHAPADALDHLLAARLISGVGDAARAASSVRA